MDTDLTSKTTENTEQFQYTDPQLAQLDEQIEGLSLRIDMLGQQMNWLCENMQSLFSFVTQMGQNGGGIRGLVKALKDQQGPQLTEQQGANHD